MRVVSLVPSWTETLLACGVNVVGRTRFCVHGAAGEPPKSIPVVGGTKDLNNEALEKLQPDLLLLDKEENLPEMATGSRTRTHITHVQSIRDMPRELGALADLLKNQPLRNLAEEWAQELSIQRQPPHLHSGPWEKALYLIWQNPWMTVSHNTFVGSMLQHLAIPTPDFPQKYPKLETIPPDLLLLLASEPYPFHKKPPNLPNPTALVDGEAFSWFGLRSLRFLQGLPVRGNV